MALQPDVQNQQQQQQQHQQHQEQHQRLQEQQNIVYIQQDSQNYRNQNYQYAFEGQNSIIGNQSFPQQNAGFGQFENQYPFVSNGHFSPPNSTAALIQQQQYEGKPKNVSATFRNPQFSDNSSVGQKSNETVHLAGGAYQSVDLQNLNYQQQSQFFLQNIGHPYQLNDILVPAYQSSGSSESSDESSLSNISQTQYSNDPGAALNNQFEFPVPVPVNNQVRNFHAQQKDFLDNYANLLQQDTQVPRCDSSKSEAAESTCSSLSSGSSEGQSENENVVRLPVLLNPILNNNVLHPYQNNASNNSSPLSNSVHHNQNGVNNRNKEYTNHSDQNLLNYTGNYGSFNTTITNGGIENVVQSNNQIDSLVVMMPNRSKNMQNCIGNSPILQNPSSDILTTSKFMIQNQKNQQKFYGIINAPNQVQQGKVNLQDEKFIQENFINGQLGGKNGNCGGFEENGNLNQNQNCDAAVLHLIDNHTNGCDIIDSDTSQIHYTSDSSVINPNFVQSDVLTKSLESESSAMFLKEPSEKSINQSISDVNSLPFESKTEFSVKNGQDKAVKKNSSFEESNPASCLSGKSSTNGLPVPVGWKRLLVDGSVIYLSPSNIALSTIEQVKMYLQTGGTCKCGLECPVNCDSVFNFNPKVISRPWDSSDSELTRLCNHKRKASLSSVTAADKSIKICRKEVVPIKRKKKKLGNGCSGVSVSQLLAQRDRALAAAAARWSTSVHAGNVDCQSIQNSQYQNVQIVRSQSQEPQQITYDNSVQPGNVFKPETSPARVTDDKTTHFPCVNVINSSGREETISNVNCMNQLLPENHSSSHELLRSSQANLKSVVVNQRAEMGHSVLGHPVNYNQPSQDLMQNAMIGPRPEGVVLAPQGMVLPPGVMMHRPRSIPPWHQTRLGLNKKQVPEAPVVYERVPCIQQHMPPPALVFEDVTSRKKHKTNSKSKKPLQGPAQNQPSFMENPSAYLAQQTALLHNTISLPNFSMTPDSRPVTVLPQTAQNLSTMSATETPNTLVNNINSSPNVLLNSSKNHAFPVRTVMGQKLDQNVFNQSQVCHKTGIETMPNQTFDDQSFNNHICSNVSCSDCKKFSTCDNERIKENLTQLNRDGRNQENLRNSNVVLSAEIFGKNDWRRSDSVANDRVTPSRVEDQINAVQENPVTSSTEKAPIVYNQKIVSDTRPIQGGTISTSNGSPQPQSSPKSSSIFRHEVLSPKCGEVTSRSPNSSSSFAVSNSVGSTVTRENEAATRYQSEYSIKKESVVLSQALSSESQHQPESPEQKFKFSTPNLVSVTTSDQKSQQIGENRDELTKTQSVTSSLDVQKEEIRKEKSEMKNRLVRTMASGHTVSSNTITSVQAGKTQTATVSINNSSPISPTTISLVNFSNQSSLNLPVAPKGSAKSPLEMVQSVVSSIQTSPAIVKNDMQPNILSVNKTVLPTSNVLNNILTTASNITTSMIANNSNTASLLKTSPGSLQTGHILVSNNGQYIVASSGNVIPQTSISGLKLNQAMPSMSASPVVTNVTGAVTQVLPAVGVAQQVLGQPTVLVNALPAPFVIQPGVMTVATGNVLPGNLIENNTLRTSVRGVTTPEKMKNKKGNKKRKNQMASLIQMASPNNVILNQPFSQQNFAVSPGGSVQSLPALTLVQGKHGAPAQIVMSNQNNFNQFNAQPQQINLLQPVNLASVPNFPAFQQFIVPGLGNMVMSTDGTTTILPDTNIGVQLQLQNVNGQNVLTPVQNTSFLNGQGILTTPAGMLIRAPNAQQKIIQNNSNPQFLSPNNSQFLVNQFQGQLSPLIAANLSPNQQIFTSSPPRQSPQEYIQIIPTSSSQNTTVVQQNTTIVQQQTTMVSNNQNILNNPVKSNFILNNPGVEKPLELQFVGSSQRQAQSTQSAPSSTQHRCSQEKIDIGTQHSVSTQTVINKEASNPGVTTSNTFCQTLNSNWSGSPPDTTTHSPVESESNRERALSPSADGTSDDCIPQAMVQYVSSSINESESESETYLLSGIPKLLTSCDIMSESNDQAKNIVESSTILQESGGQLEIGNGYAPSRRFKSTIDECVVSSHSDMRAQEKRAESQPSITCYQEEKAKFVDVLLAETGPRDLDEEAKFSELKEKLSEGDLVWGSVRGSLAWPGKLVGPVSPGGRVLVRWFGGHGSPTRVNASQLQSLSQGLEAHHRASNKGRKNRRLNAELEAAIQEAMLELDKMSAQEKKVTSGSGRPRRSNR